MKDIGLVDMKIRVANTEMRLLFQPGAEALAEMVSTHTYGATIADDVYAKVKGALKALWECLKTAREWIRELFQIQNIAGFVAWLLKADAISLSQSELLLANC